MQRRAVSCPKVRRYFLKIGTEVQYRDTFFKTAVLAPTFSFISGDNNCKLGIAYAALQLLRKP